MDTNSSEKNSPIRAEKLQPTWVEIGLLDIRHFTGSVAQAPQIIDEGATEADAYMLLIQHFGFGDNDEVFIETPIGNISAQRGKLNHIVEKRQDARERYVKFALETLKNPFEIWSTLYEDGSSRLGFIGVFEGKNQMFVIVLRRDEEVLWNFMHCDKKSLNKHRRGTLLYIQK